MREAFSIFDADGDGRVSLAQVVDTMVRIYKVGLGFRVWGSEYRVWEWSIEGAARAEL